MDSIIQQVRVKIRSVQTSLETWNENIKLQLIDIEWEDKPFQKPVYIKWWKFEMQNNPI